MTQQELTILNLGQSLDDLANLDPRGYGVCKILYKASREKVGMPLCMNAAQKLVGTLNEGAIVYIMTGFVLRPFKNGETDGIISSVLLARSLVLAFGAKPVVIIPEENREAVTALSAVAGLHLFENLDEMIETPVSMGVVVFTKDRNEAKEQAKSLFESYTPKAAIAVECPGENDIGNFHNAIGLDVTALEAKQDSLFDIIKENGVLNIAIGDLGNELGMGAIREHIERFIPYAAKGECNCPCSGGIVVRTATDNIMTATVSDWGCYSLIAALAFLKGDIEIMHTPETEKEACEAACRAGMIDMYGWRIPAIDGFGLEINMPIVQLMREMVVQALSLKTKCRTWFEKVEEKGFFDCE